MNNNNSNAKFPSLFFDSDRITNLRKTAQKKFHEDDLVSFYLIRPFSVYISSFIVKRTTLSANSITFIMMLLSFLFPFILFYSTNIDCLFVYGPVLFFILYILDVVDGEVARLRNKTSILGEFYDASLWFTLPAYFVIYIYKICEFQNLSTSLIVYALVTVSCELFLLVSKELFGKKNTFDFLNQKQNSKYKIILFIKFILTKQNIYILYPILFYLVNNYFVKGDVIFLGFWIGLLSLYNIYNIIKFNKIVIAIND